jgi:hypothetical protein
MGGGKGLRVACCGLEAATKGGLTVTEIIIPGLEQNS